MTSNKKIGNNSEEIVAVALQKQNYWVLRIPPNSNGQPADIIAIRNGVPYLLEIKHVEGKSFKLSRIEPNQIHALNYFELFGGKSWVIFVLDDNSMYMLSWKSVEMMILNNWRKIEREYIKEIGNEIKNI